MFRQLSGCSGKLFGFKISEKTVLGEDVKQMGIIMAEKIAAYGKIRLLVEIEGFSQILPQALIKKFKFAWEHDKNIERIAVLSDRIWIKSYVKVGGLRTVAVVEHFNRSDIEAALKWLEC